MPHPCVYDFTEINITENIAEIADEDTGEITWSHGWYGYTVKQCRCEICRAANAKRTRRYRKKRAAESMTYKN